MIDLRPTLVEARGNAAQRAGIYYERKVASYFSSQFLCAIQPTIRRQNARDKRPDLLLFDEELTSCVVVEVKYSFFPGAFVQLATYASLVKKELPWVRVGTLVVCKNFEPQAGTRLVDKTQLFSLSEKPEAVWVLSDRELRVGRSHGLFVGGGALPAAVRQLGAHGNTVRRGGRVLGVAAKAGAR